MQHKVDQAKSAMIGKDSKVKEPTEQDFLSTGITLLNLAMYNRVNGGILKGHIYRVAGRSSSGKTFLCRTILAEAVNNPAFNGYELVYDDVERGALMDTERFFGKKLVERLVAPAIAKDRSPIYSTTIGDFYNRIRTKLEKGTKLIWIEDSLDALASDRESKMTDGKAKINSQEMRKLVDPLQQTGSILVIISQVRTNMQPVIPGMRMMVPEDIISGGRAPEFYSTADIILRKSKTLKTTYKTKKYTTGHRISARITKNRLSGLDHTVYFPFYRTYGIDDIGANVDFLIDNGYWSKDKSGVMTADEFCFTGSVTKLITRIEKENEQQKLAILVGKVWREIQEACSTSRKPRYL